MHVAIGIFIGLVIAMIAGAIVFAVIYSKCGHGYYRITELDREADAYTISIKLNDDPKILKKKRVVLERDFGEHISQN